MVNKKPKNPEYKNVQITANKSAFQTTDKLEFKLNVETSPKILPLTYSNQKVYAQEGTFEDKGLKIKPKLINTNNEEQINLPLTIEKIDDSEYLISGDPPGDFLAPGAYRLDIELTKNEQTQSVTQDFSWGVLALNTNKSTYQSKDKAKITMAVLNEKGDMVCDADVVLNITNPKGKIATFSTSTNTIHVNDGCKKKEFVWEPDYEADYFIGRELGDYKMALSANTNGKTYKIEDSFSVSKKEPYDVERITATRIYPREQYPVIIAIKANEDYSGTVSDILPRDFKVFDLPQEEAEKYANRKFKGEYLTNYEYQFIEELSPTDLYRPLTWQVNFEKGKTYYLGYKYDAPNKSPNFFKMGPLQIGDQYKENRIWQIAVDYTYELPHASVFTDTKDTGPAAVQNVYEDIPVTTISHATLNSAGFSDTETVLIITDIVFDENSNASAVVGFQVADTAGTAVNGTNVRREIRTADDRNEWMRTMTRTTKTSGEGFVIQRAYHTTYNDPTIFKGSIIVIGLGDLEDGVEYKYAEYTGSDAIGAVGNPLTSLTLTTPTNSPAWNGDVFVMDSWLGDSNTSADGLTHYLEIDGTNYNIEIQGGEDTMDIFGGSSTRVFNTGDENAHTLKIKLENDDGTTTSYTHNYSSMIAFPATLFEDFEYATTDVSSNATSAHSELVGITPFTPQSAGEFFITGNAFAESNANNSDNVRIRLQVGGSNVPSGFTDTLEGTMIETNAVDTYDINWAALETFTTASKDIDLDGASDVTSVDWEYKTLVAFSMGTTNVDIGGTLFTDDDEVTPIGTTSVCVAVDTAFNTNNCTTTDASGNYTITNVFAGTAGSDLALYADGGVTLANTLTTANGSDLTGINLYQNHIVLRDESDSAVSIIDIDEYDNDQNATDFLFDATDSAPDTLTWESGAELYIPSGITFTPGGNTNGHDIEIDGTWAATSTETINVDGTFKLDSGGTFTPASSTLTFDATSGTEDLITAGTGDLYNLTINDGGGGSLIVEVEDPLTVQNDLTITEGTLDAKTGESNQITVGGNWVNNDTFEARNGLVLFNGEAATYTLDAQGTGNDAFYDIEFNDNVNAGIYQLTTDLDVSNDLTISSGTLDSNTSDIYVGRNWINGDIFLEGTNTVYLDTGASATLTTGCISAATCTDENFYNLSIDKGNGGDIVTLTTNDLRVTNTLTLTSGEFIQTTDDVRLEGTTGTALQLYDFGRYTNLSTGNLTLGGSVVNDYGAITLDSNGSGCGDADGITIASTAAVTRSWSGAGAFRITDISASYQTGSATIKAGDSTDSGNNGANWIFVPCGLFEFEGLNLEGIKID